MQRPHTHQDFIIFEGETGTGKSTLARLHQTYHHRKTLEEISCFSLPEKDLSDFLQETYRNTTSGGILFRHIDALASQQFDLVLNSQEIARSHSLNLYGTASIGFQDRQDSSRKSVTTYQVPPLSERRQDIFYFLIYYFRELSRELGKSVSHIERTVFRQAENYSWPGNLHELRYAIRDAILRAKTEVITSLPIEPIFLHEQTEEELLQFIRPILEANV